MNETKPNTTELDKQRQQYCNVKQTKQ